MITSTYVLVTPVRNEEGTISKTIEAVIAQTVRPKSWIIVSDQSTDRTDEIIEGYTARFPFLQSIRIAAGAKRNFASVVFATEMGISTLGAADYDYIGLLDADVQFGPDYYEQILKRFSSDPGLGLAGGLVIDCYDGKRIRTVQSLEEVAGAVQFFRRDCFDSLGGLVALPEGGWDAITCVQARMNGFRTRTFPELEVDHLKPRNAAEGSKIRRIWQLGVRDYALGNHPAFEIAKSIYRFTDRPYVLAGILRLAGYSSCYLRGRKRLIPPVLIEQIRKEQLSRLWRRSGLDSSQVLRVSSAARGRGLAPKA